MYALILRSIVEYDNSISLAQVKELIARQQVVCRITPETGDSRERLCFPRGLDSNRIRPKWEYCEETADWHDRTTLPDRSGSMPCPCNIISRR